MKPKEIRLMLAIADRARWKDERDAALKAAQAPPETTAARARWTDPLTHHREGVKRAHPSREAAEAWVRRMEIWAATGLDTGSTLAAYVEHIGDRWTRGIDPTSTYDPYSAGLVAGCSRRWTTSHSTWSRRGSSTGPSTSGQRVAGHQDPAVTSRYLHPDVRAMLDAGTAFSAWWSGTGPAKPSLGVDIEQARWRRASDALARYWERTIGLMPVSGTDSILVGSGGFDAARARTLRRFAEDG